MNYDLAVMALDGLSRSPVTVAIEKGTVKIFGDSAGLKELARLFLLLGSDNVASGESVVLSPGIHVSKQSPAIEIELTG